MEKKIIFAVKGKTISETCPLHWSSNTVDYIKAGFVLDDEWKSCDVVRAAWSGRQGTIITLLDADDSCVVPHEVLAVYGKVSVNLYGVKYDDDGEEFTRITTAPVTAIIIDSTARIDGSETAPITPSQFEQFVQAVKTETEKVTGMTAVAETLPTGSDATASYSDGVLTLGLPRGVKGDAGERGEPGATGPAGATGNGIQSITKTGSSGLVDTYTILFTDGTSTTFTVTNGKDGSADIHWGDLQGSIADQADLQAALNDKQGKLTAGTNITIDENNVISAAGGSGGGAVDSVNGKTGVVVLDADDVGALPDTTTASDLGAYVKPSSGIPKTDLASAVQSSLNKADTALQTAPVTSVNTKTGAVSLTASDLGAYTKPSTGIPKADLASSVQTSLGKADTALQSAPVTSVNSKTGAVSLSASDVGALPDSTTIPTKTSDLTNDSGFLTSAGAVTSFNGQHGAVTYTAPVTSVNGQTGAVTVTVPTKTSDLQNDSGYITSAPVSSVDGKTGAVTVIPTGGTTGQVLAKASNTDRDVEWVNQSGGGGSSPWTNDETVLASGTFDSATTTAWHQTPTGLTVGDFRRYKYFKLTLKLATASSIYIRLVSKDYRFVETQSNTQHDILFEFLDKEHRFYRYWTCSQYVTADAESPILYPIVGSLGGDYPSNRVSSPNLKIGYIPEDLLDTEQLALMNNVAQTGDGAWKIRGAIEE